MSARISDTLPVGTDRSLAAIHTLHAHPASLLVAFAYDFRGQAAGLRLSLTITILFHFSG